MTADAEVNLTRGHVLRHAPAQSAQGADAALIDIAQDLLLRHLDHRGVLEQVAFKGGTALRKMYAGAAGRFSTDLDFSVARLDDDASTVVDLLCEEIDGARVAPFSYGIVVRRGRPTIEYSSELGESMALASKLDVGPPPWLEPVRRGWTPVPIHDRYGGPLPDLLVVALAENAAEKIARLNRRSPARDVYDLVWISGAPSVDVARPLVRRLAVLKTWVDLHGITTGTQTWAPLPGARPFDVDRWLLPRSRREFDDEQIGLLTTPAPDLDALGEELAARYRWLGDLDDDERRVAAGGADSRGLVLRLLGELPGRRLTGRIR